MMARKRNHSIALEKVSEDIDRWLDDEDEDEGDDLHELYGTPELEGDSDDDEDLDETRVDIEKGEEEQILRKKVYPKKLLTKNRRVNSIGTLQYIGAAGGHKEQ